VTNRASDYLTEKQLHAIFESNPTSIAALSRLTGLSKDILSELNASDLFNEQVSEKLDV
jgi:ATP-dependent DNA helicase RecQ